LAFRDHQPKVPQKKGRESNTCLGNIKTEFCISLQPIKATMRSGVWYSSVIESLPIMHKALDSPALEKKSRGLRGWLKGTCLAKAKL
jgi:hypothetical protein